jgi:flavin reductase (DIM6/NTAB) family NADH-FMN oxidoreductase RutF
MSIDRDSFRQTLSRFASGVTVVSTRRADGTPIGVTVSSFCSVSLEPPLILVCLDKANQDVEAYAEGKSFAVNVLAADQAVISNTFAFPGPVPPFKTIPFSEGLDGVPMLEGAAATLQCARHATHDGGDHWIVVGRVEEAAWTEKPLLIYAEGSYKFLSESTEAAD